MKTTSSLALAAVIGLGGGAAQAQDNVAKLGLGIVELENGMRITGQVKITNPKLGMPVTGKVEIVREAEYSKNYGMVFYPG